MLRKIKYKLFPWHRIVPNQYVDVVNNGIKQPLKMPRENLIVTKFLIDITNTKN